MPEIKTLTGGTVLGEWRLGKPISRGGQGEVWEVRPADVKHSPPRAMKVCIPSDQRARRRFEREVRLLASLTHENIVPVLDSSTTWEGRTNDGKPLGYYVTERFDHTVSELRWVHDAPLFALDMFRVVCGAIDYLHQQSPQILHRDIKPSNILLGAEPFRVAVADLGIAAEEDAEQLTQTLEVVGTPFYRAPEVIAGAGGSVLSDVYSLGRLLEWLLVGKTPSELEPRPTPVERRISNSVREHLDSVVRKACSYRDYERYQSVSQLLVALRPLHADFANDFRERTEEQTPSSAPTSSSSYRRTAKILQDKDAVAWRGVVKQQRRQLTEALRTWRAERERKHPSSVEETQAWMSDLLVLAGPCVADALAAAEFPNEAFGNGSSLLRNLEHVPGWNGSGLTILVEAPRGMMYVAQNLLGATNAATGNIEGALAVARFSTTDRQGDSEELWRVGEIVAWPKSLGGNAMESWKYLRTLPEEHPWLLEVFGELWDYQVALAAYWWILSFVEFASNLAAGRTPASLGDGFRLGVPPLMLLENRDLYEQGWKHAFPDRRQVAKAADAVGVDPVQVRTHWPAWADATIKYAIKMNRNAWLHPSDFRVPVLPQ